LKGEAKDLGTPRAELGEVRPGEEQNIAVSGSLAHCCDQVLDADQVASSL
jgi:hypothetical protein